MKDYQFSQHIRTSSKVKRGFRTYQKTGDVDEVLEDKLGKYGLYAPTFYETLDDIKIEDYPELFLFYKLENKTIICSSKYVGLDLHSYPPRAGNYIAHSLIYKDNQPVNPVQIYKNAPWKQSEEVITEDAEGNIPRIVQSKITFSNEEYDKSYFKNLLLNDSDSKNKQRAEVLKTAIDAIILKRKIVIIDEKDMLIHWTMTLLQLFPVAFVFENIKITSFANSSLLFDVCNVLCFEKENEEPAKRYAKNNEAIILELGGRLAKKNSIYATLIVQSLIDDTFDTFRREVFKEFNRHSNYTLEEFDKHTRYFAKLTEIGEMQQEEFSNFVESYAGEKEKEEAIFGQLCAQKLWDKFMSFWEGLVKKKVLNDFERYQEISRFVHPPETDKYWIGFERDIVEKLTFRDIGSLIRYYETSNIEDEARMVAYYRQSMLILENPNNTISTREDIIQQILTTFISLDKEQRLKLEEESVFLSGLKQIKKGSSSKEISKKIFEYWDKLITDAHFMEVFDSITLPISWELFFELNEKYTTEFLKLYEIQKLERKLPHKKLAIVILRKDYIENNRVLIEAYTNLNNGEKSDFEKNAPPEILQIILEAASIIKLSDFENLLRLKEYGIELEEFMEKIKNTFEEDDKFMKNLKLELFDSKYYQPKYPIIYSIRKELNKTFYKKSKAERDSEKIEVPVDEYVENIGENKNQSNQTSINQRIDFFEYFDCLDEINSSHLLAFLSPPWDYFSWQLFSEKYFSSREHLRLTVLVCGAYEEIKAKGNQKQFHFDIDDWRLLIPEYLIFLIISDKIVDFQYFVKHTSMNWRGYDYIRQRLKVLFGKNKNDTSVMFFSIKDKSRTFNRQPKWKFSTNEK